MKAFFVVSDDPLMSDFVDLVARRKEPAVQDLGTIGTIKAFDESVLIRLAELDVEQFDALFRAPIDKILSGQLGPIIQSNRLWQAAPGCQLL